MKKKYLIIGSSAAGMAAIQKLRQLDSVGQITCITQESEFTYNKCFLADYLSGIKTDQQIQLKQASFFIDNNVNFITNCTIESIDKAEKKVIAQDGRCFEYTHLLLAVGGSVVIPPVEDINTIDNLFKFYTFDDIQKIIGFLNKKKNQSVAIIGAGLSGLECADSLIKYTDQITLIERQDYVLPHLITRQAADFLQEKIKNAGITLYTEINVQKITQSLDKTITILFDNGKTIQVDAIICALGARPNLSLALNAGLQVQKGVVVNKFMQTTDPFIFAAGDIVQVKHKVTGLDFKSCLWPDAIQQAIVAASCMAGFEKEYSGSLPIISSAFFGIKLFISGNKQLFLSDNAMLQQDKNNFKIVVQENNKVVGFLLLGNHLPLLQLKQALLLSKSYNFHNN